MVAWYLCVCGRRSYSKSNYRWCDDPIGRRRRQCLSLVPSITDSLRLPFRERQPRAEVDRHRSGESGIERGLGRETGRQREEDKERKTERQSQWNNWNIHTETWTLYTCRPISMQKYWLESVQLLRISGEGGSRAVSVAYTWKVGICRQRKRSKGEDSRRYKDYVSAGI